MKQLLLLAATLSTLIVATSAAAGQRVPEDNSPDSTSESEPTLFLPVVFGAVSAHRHDMTRYMIGDGRLYEVQHSGGSQARHQTQIGDGHFYHTKGNEVKAEWEELWVKDAVIYRGTDTSPGNDQYYTLYEDDVPGSAWSPRFWSVGDLYERNPYVVFYRKTNCQIVASGFQRSWLRFEAFYPAYTFESGIRLQNVIELTWLLREDGDPIESYFYADSYGLVGWGSVDRGFSYVSEIHAPGQRPDNKREEIACLASTTDRLLYSPELNFGPLPPGFRAK